MEDLILLVTLKLLLKSTLYSVSTGFLRFYELLLLDLSNYLHHDALTRSRHGDNSGTKKNYMLNQCNNHQY